MAATTYQTDLDHVSDLLKRWIAPHVDDAGLQWLEDKQQEIRSGAPAWKFFTSFSAVPRYLGKADLRLSEADLREATAARSGWQPVDWSTDQAGRALLVLSLPHEDVTSYLHTLNQVFETADLGESVALYQSLPLLPYPEQHLPRAVEGLRTNITSTFNAIVLRNPYPAEFFEEHAWNHLILKAVFVGSPLHLVFGLDRRANAELARMLVDYAHERWAASRNVTPELWRLVGPFAGEAFMDDLERAFNSDDPAEHEAAALALAQAGSPRSQAILEQDPALKNRIEKGELTWDDFSRNRMPASA